MGTKSYDEFLQEELKDSELAAEYLTAAIEDGALDCPASAESEHFKNLLSYKSSGELRGGRYGEAKEEKTI